MFSATEANIICTPEICSKVGSMSMLCSLLVLGDMQLACNLNLNLTSFCWCLQMVLRSGVTEAGLDTEVRHLLVRVSHSSTHDKFLQHAKHCAMHTLLQVRLPGQSNRLALNLMPLLDARQARSVIQQNVLVQTAVLLHARQRGVLYVEGRLCWLCRREVK